MIDADDFLALMGLTTLTVGLCFAGAAWFLAYIPW